MKRLSAIFFLFLLPNIALAKAIDEVVTYGSKISPPFFGVLLILSLLHSRHWFRLKIRDGWSWDKHANRALFVSLLCSSTFYHYWPEKIFVHVAAHWWLLLINCASAVVHWSLTELVLKAKFQDPYEIKRSRNFTLPFSSKLILLNALLLCGALFSVPWLQFSQDILLVSAIAIKIWHFEWTYSAKHSSSRSFLYFISIFALAITIPFHFEAPAYLCGLLVLSMGIARIRLQSSAQKEANVIVKNSISAMQAYQKGSIKLNELCNQLQDEWAMARVTIVNIDKQDGNLLASAGPKALLTNDLKPRRLGPILRRVTRESHAIYSPVASELGGESVFQRLRHSSFAVPLFQEENITAAICLMAEGEEKIQRHEARVMEMVCRQLTNEVLSAVALTKLEIEDDHLKSLLRRSNGLLLEAGSSEMKRVIIRAEIQCCNGILPSLEKRYRTELWAAWASLREVFGFLALDRNDSSFWAISPLVLGPAVASETGILTASFLLADLLARQAEQISRDDGFRALNLQGAKIILSSGAISEEKLCTNIFCNMENLASTSSLEFGNLYSSGLPKDLLDEFSITTSDVICISPHRDVYAWKELLHDKKETRKLESLAQQLAKNLKGAA